MTRVKGRNFFVAAVAGVLRGASSAYEWMLLALLARPMLAFLAVLVSFKRPATARRLRALERLCYPRFRSDDAGAVRVRLVHSEPGLVQAGDEKRGTRPPSSSGD